MSLSLYPVSGILIRNHNQFANISYFMPIDPNGYGSATVGVSVCQEWLGDYGDPTVFKKPYQVNQLKGVLETLKRLLQSRMNVTSLIRMIKLLNHLAYHVLDPEFLSEVKKVVNLEEYMERLFRVTWSKFGDPHPSNFTIKRFLYLMLMNYSYFHGKSLRKNKYLMKMAFDQSVKDFTKLIKQNDEFIESEACCLYHSWVTLFNVVVERRRSKVFKFNHFLTLYRKKQKKEFNLREFMTKTMIPLFESYFVRRKKLPYLGHQHFMLHPYVLLYEVLIGSMSVSLNEFKYQKVLGNSPKMVLSILQDMSYFTEMTCSDTKIEQLSKIGTKGTSWPSDVNTTQFRLLHYIFMTINNFGHRIVVPSIILTKKYVRFISKKSVQVHKATVSYKSSFMREQHGFFMNLYYDSVSIFSRIIMYSPTEEIRGEIVDTAGDFFIKLMKSYESYRNQMSTDEEEWIQEEVVRILTSLFPSMVENKNEAIIKWFEAEENDGWGLCYNIINSVFSTSGEIGSQFKEPFKPFKNFRQANIVLFSMNILNRFLDREVASKNIKFFFDEDGDEYNYCMFEKILICFYKGPTRTKSSICNFLSYVCSMFFTFFQPMKRFFKEKKEKLHCQLPLFMATIKKEMEKCVVDDHKKNFERSLYFLEHNIVPENITTEKDVKKLFFGMGGEGEGIVTNPYALVFEDMIMAQLSLVDAKKSRIGLEDDDDDDDESSEEEEEKVKREKERERLKRSGVGKVEKDCGYCHTHNAAKRCSLCNVRYCGAGCQRKHWEVHKLVCVGFKKKKKRKK